MLLGEGRGSPRLFLGKGGAGERCRQLEGTEETVRVLVCSSRHQECPERRDVGQALPTPREHQAGQGQLRLWGQPPLCTHFSTYSITTFSNSSRLYYGASHLQASLAAKGLVSQKKLDSTEKTALLTAT